ncbi:zinc ribbon domain-containing protein [Clostridium niameyense]|uniref:Zinc ribbon domain-containing protein n=1 Tax=Clostridium niameyense TaxID=1622073 RepID=A0A6M0R942_9CLOT|nr:zinc ribbon domain-containing protein [Clostridium niameyense]NEZ46784.1 zinc ribbon domain-containing protein [Clostridium niameyense]
MFFLGVFGIEPREKKIGEVDSVECIKCGMFTRYTIIKTYNVFHFFFLPLIKWGEKYYLKSRCCNTIYEINKEDINKINESKSLQDITIKEIYSDINYSSICADIICPNCKRKMEKNFTYCPYCGKKINF